MTLLDAPQYNARRANLFRNLSIAAVAIVLVAGFCVFWFWTWPAQHRLDGFFESIEAGDLAKAYGEWNHDPNWEQHKQQYSGYDFGQFTKDWGPMGDYGKIHSHKIVMAKSVGNGTVMGVDVNGGKTPIFLRVDDKTKQIGYSPVELYVGP